MKSKVREFRPGALPRGFLATSVALTLLLLAALIAPPADAAIWTKTVPPDYFAVSPGKIGPLRMGDTVARAKRLGMIAWADVCGDVKGWTPGTKHVNRNRYWLEYYPDAVSGRRVRSYWIKGDDFRTTKGLRPGSSVARALRAYPSLRARGTAYDDPSDSRFAVYSVGSRTRGYLDLYFTANGPNYRPGTLAFAYVRTSGVPIKRRFADGC